MFMHVDAEKNHVQKSDIIAKCNRVAIVFVWHCMLRADPAFTGTAKKCGVNRNSGCGELWVRCEEYSWNLF